MTSDGNSLHLCFQLFTNIHSLLRSSAGTIRAVPDTVKKVPGLAPVLLCLSYLYFLVLIYLIKYLLKVRKFLNKTYFSKINVLFGLITLEHILFLSKLAIIFFCTCCRKWTKLTIHNTHGYLL